MLSKFAGIDYSNSGFGPDFATNAKPVLESLDLQGKVTKAAQESHSVPEAIARINRSRIVRNVVTTA